MSRSKITGVAVACIVAATALATPTHATPVTFSFSGEITRVEDVVGRLGGQITEGMPFSGMYTFESTAVDGEPDDPTFGRYFDAVTSLSGMVGDVPFSALGPMRILVNHDPAFPVSSYFVFGPVDLLGLNLDFSIGFNDPTASIFSSDALPLVPFPLDGLNISGFSLNSQPLGIIIGGSVQTLVPEPTTICMLAFGAAFLAQCERRRRHAASRAGRASPDIDGPE